MSAAFSLNTRVQSAPWRLRGLQLLPGFIPSTALPCCVAAARSAVAAVDKAGDVVMCCGLSDLRGLWLWTLVPWMRNLEFNHFCLFPDCDP